MLGKIRWKFVIIIGLYIFYRLPEYKIAGVENFKNLSSKEIEIYPTVSGLESYSKFVEVLIILTWIDFIYIFCGHYITLIQILCSCLLSQLDFIGPYRNNVGTEGKGLKFQQRLRSRLKNCRQGFKIWKVKLMLFVKDPVDVHFI